MKRFLLSGGLPVLWIILPVLAVASDAEGLVVDDDSIEVYEVQLDEAQERLSEAAREIAELSTRISQDVLKGFAIDMDDRAMLGVNIGGGDDDETEGVRIVGVTPGGPADEAGIETGDVLLEIDGHLLVGDETGERFDVLTGYMKTIEPGDEVTVRYRRDGEELTTKVTTSEFDATRFAFGIPFDLENFEIEIPDIDIDPDLRIEIPRVFAFPRFHHWANMEMVSLTQQLGSYFGTDEGVLVVRAVPDNEFGLEDGDVILTVDGRTARDPGHVMRILRSYDEGETVSLEVMRQRHSMTLSAVVPQFDENTLGRHRRVYRFKNHSPNEDEGT